MKEIFKKASAITAVIILTVSSVTFTHADSAMETQEASWKDSIDDMLSSGEYTEGEVLAVIDNSKADADNLTCLDADEENEALASVSDEAVEETFDVTLTDSESAADIRLITSDSKTTKELLLELSEDDSVIYAEPNYIQYSEDYDETETGSQTSEISDAQDTSDPETASLLEDNSTADVKRAKPSTTPVDLINTQGYEQTSDLSYLQKGYGADDKLYTINSPSWNTRSGKNVNYKTTPVVAVIDSGVDYTHPDLKDHIVDMTKYSTLGGRYGYNCSGDGKEDDTMDTNGHGTHCAGIIAAAWDGTGTSGVASGVDLCIVRASANSAFPDSAVIKAFHYLSDAVDNGLNLYSVNCSFGGDGCTPTQLLATNELGRKGVVICYASANSSFNNDENLNTSSDCSLSPYSVVVNSATLTGYASDFTDFGQTTTDIFTPGDAILSTVCTESASYFASVDKNRVAYDGFTDSTSDSAKVSISYYGIVDTNEQTSITFADTDSFAKYIDSLESTGSRVQYEDSFDGDGYSYKLDVPALSSSSERAVYILKVPVAEDQLSKASAVCAALKSSLDRCEVWLRSVAFEDTNSSNIKAEVAGNGGWRRPNQVWVNQDVINYSENTDTMRGVPYYDGCLYYIILIADMNETQSESQLYVDSVGAGYSTLRYSYYQGTSMATPAATASAAILYDQLLCAGKLDNLSASEKAIYVANTMKAKVNNQTENFNHLSTSEGTFDFNVSEADYAPVISTVTEDETSITLTGQYFGKTQGSIQLNSKECTISSWSESEIVFEIPSGTENGWHSLDMTASNGKKTTRKIVIDQLESRKVFENYVELPEEIANCKFTSMISMDGVVYIVPETLTGDYSISSITNQLWSYDPETDAWCRLADIPIVDEARHDNSRLKVSIAANDGVIAACVSYMTKDGESVTTGDIYYSNCREFNDLIYLYDMQNDRWIQADVTGLNQKGQIFAADFGFFYYGGQKVTTEPVSGSDTLTHRVEENSYQILKLDFDKSAISAAKDTIPVTAKDAGTTSKAYFESGAVTCYGNTVFIVDRSCEWIEWSPEDQKFTPSKDLSIPESMKMVGGIGKETSYVTEFTGAITPLGTLVIAANGDAYLNRGYDTFFYNQDGKVSAFEKNAAIANLHYPLATYSNGLLFVCGSTYYNGSTAAGYLAYTQLVNTETETETMYRLYNPNSGEHLYTASTDEVANLISIGWSYEGAAWNAPVSSDTPVYRLYNPNSGDHHYTTSTEERDWLVGLGWQDEGIAWYSGGDVPVYRLFNPNTLTATHHYSAFADERTWLTGLGWQDENIAWYAVSVNKK